MHPNYDFENELPQQWGIKNYEFRIMADELLKKYKVISKKEYDIIMWVGCNLNSSSIVKEALFDSLKKKQLTLKLLENNNNQLNLNL